MKLAGNEAASSLEKRRRRQEREGERKRKQTLAAGEIVRHSTTTQPAGLAQSCSQTNTDSTAYE